MHLLTCHPYVGMYKGYDFESRELHITQLSCALELPTSHHYSEVKYLTQDFFDSLNGKVVTSFLERPDLDSSVLLQIQGVPSLENLALYIFNRANSILAAQSITERFLRIELEDLGDSVSYHYDDFGL